MAMTLLTKTNGKTPRMVIIVLSIIATTVAGGLTLQCGNAPRQGEID
jgi:hypothetical protein